MYITTNNNGDILGVSMPVAGTQLQEGLQDDGFYVFKVDNSLRPETLIQTKYWDFENSCLETRPESPGTHYKWEEGQWLFIQESLEAELRESRFIKLIESDWTQIPDSPLTAEQKTEWATYRQALRDITDTLTGSERSIEDITWPEQPTI
jgi:hypothetical protein